MKFLFSTASIAGPGNKVIKEAQTHGTGYVRSKYNAYRLQTLPIKKVVTLFPTLVLEMIHILTHISSGHTPFALYEIS